ncbi:MULTISPECIES: hypothetical protein [Bradyrhizobium]|uniref:hypothetical protein n=1 Tax=Bradyrhizobium TaxID=374 RepID=UPI001EDB1806|nr:hypothetical protein [Bradyrhizobium zhengyangense]MCG2645656.1 hypothetical protein [Bradyrhizobium zhengyangense]
MAKELKSAQELSDAICQVVAMPGFDVVVHRDQAYGWRPTVQSAPLNSISFQRRVEEIADRTRPKYDLAT